MATATAPVALSENLSPHPPDAQIVHESKDKPFELTDQTNLLPVRQIITVFLALSLCSVVTSLDSLIVSSSLATVSAVFHAGAVSSWVPAAYLLTSTTTQPFYGRFSDIFGRKNVLCLAMSIYILGNLIAGFSKSIIQLIVCRGIAGAGGGGISSMVQILISDIVPLRERGKYIGVAAGVVAAGYTVGPVIGGVLAERSSWRWCFWVTLPLAVLATIVAIVVTPAKPVAGGMRQKLKIIDYAGIVLSLGGGALIMLPLIWVGVLHPWKSAIVLAPLCCGIFVVGLFCIWEWKGAKLPIIPMRIFKHLTVTGVYICMFVNGFIFFSALYYLPQFFQVVLQYSATYSGIFLIPVVLSQTFSSLLAGFSVSHTGKYRTVTYSGFTLAAIASGCISLFTVNTSHAVMVVLMIINGAGLGMTMQTTTVAAQASVARKDMSIVTAVRNFIRMLGGAIALPAASSLLNNAIRESMVNLGLPSSTITSIINNPTYLNNSSNLSSLGISSSQAADILSKGYTQGFKDIFLLNAALAATATVASAVMIKHKELLRGDEERLRKEARAVTGDEENRLGLPGSHQVEEQIELASAVSATKHGIDDSKV
ncbi:MFS general substrate transporter [Gymnopus androsaceus JB14]|uniref:MFS general substrate transporter n=1 Tax=Gymnopus androsaceus JB14 TaxID=1447944 RepID=A0A6A4GYY8_9AGAR|nr:MFS general substrate transporter [Gymnopus androsaceus JB14]